MIRYLFTPNFSQDEYLTQNEFIELCSYVGMPFDAEQLANLHTTVDETEDGMVAFRGFSFVGKTETLEVRRSRVFSFDDEVRILCCLFFDLGLT